MAYDFHVQGPTTLTLASNGAGGFSSAVVGVTTNENPWEISPSIYYKPITSTETGDVPADHVYTGKDAVISGTLSKWNPDVMEVLLGAIVGDATADNTEGNIGQIGAKLSSETGNLAMHEYTLTIAPVIATATGSVRHTWVFPRVILAAGNSFSYTDLYNDNTKIPISFYAFPTAAGSLYTRSPSPA